MVTKSITDGERPPRPSKGKKLGLSNELWELVQSSWVHEAKKRPQVDAFVEFLEQAIPSLAMLEELAEFDANSEDDVRNLRHMFSYGDSTLFGMRENETLAVVEVFDRVSFFAHHSFTPLGSF
jgi:hypothetical protein